MIKKSILFNFLIFFLFFQMIENVNAEEPILISISSNLDQVIFDGKWTDAYEWKQSSYNQLSFDDGSFMHLRTAHQGNFIYIQINFQTDTNIDKDSDHAIVCFDTKNDKTLIAQSDDYCFSTFLDVEKSFTYQGNNISTTDDSFTMILNDKNFVAVGTASDKHDRYSKIPHASYEFKIPLELLGRSDNYGFSVSVFDGHSQNYYSWPHNIDKQNNSLFSSPNQWGDIVSPDKSLPEFNLIPLFTILLPSLFILIIISKFNNLKNLVFKN